jgi:hypothetical protein
MIWSSRWHRRTGTSPDLSITALYIPAYLALHWNQYADNAWVAVIRTPTHQRLPQVRGSAPHPFHYRDKGIMAMIGRKAAIAEIGAHRHEIHGELAFAAWLGVHVELLDNIGAQLKAYVAWAQEFYVRPGHRSAELLEPSCIDSPRINWDQKG